MSVRHHLEEQIANEDKGYAIKTVKHQSHHEKWYGILLLTGM